MTEAECIELISARAVARWATETGLAASTLVLENEALPQTGSFGLVTVGQILSTPLTAGSSGNRKEERRGLILVKLWTPENTGRKTLSTLADAVRRIFAGQVLTSGSDSLVIQTGSMGVTATEGGFFMGMLSFEFRCYASY